MLEGRGLPAAVCQELRGAAPEQGGFGGGTRPALYHHPTPTGRWDQPPHRREPEIWSVDWGRSHRYPPKKNPHPGGEEKGREDRVSEEGWISLLPPWALSQILGEPRRLQNPGREPLAPQNLW